MIGIDLTLKPAGGLWLPTIYGDRTGGMWGVPQDRLQEDREAVASTAAVENRAEPEGNA